MNSVAYLGFRGGQNIFGKLGVFAWRFAPCSAWQRKNSKKKFHGTIWCVLENILLKFGKKKIYKYSFFI